VPQSLIIAGGAENMVAKKLGLDQKRVDQRRQSEEAVIVSRG
jgi:hypothetical protein